MSSLSLESSDGSDGRIELNHERMGEDTFGVTLLMPIPPKTKPKNVAPVLGTVVGGGLSAGLLQVIDSAYLATFAGAVSSALTLTLEAVGRDLSERLLSPREDYRLGVSVLCGITKAQENEAAGLHLRDDGFFVSQLGDRSSAEEVVEALWLTIQREYEERKIPFETYLGINIAYRSEIDLPQAHMLLKLASNMSYRQHCLLAALTTKSEWRFKKITDIDSASQRSVSHEFVSLGFDGVLVDRAHGGAVWGGASLGTMIAVSEVGLLLYRLMELWRIEDVDRLKAKEDVHALELQET